MSRSRSRYPVLRQGPQARFPMASDLSPAPCVCHQWRRFACAACSFPSHTGVSILVNNHPQRTTTQNPAGLASRPPDHGGRRSTDGGGWASGGAAVGDGDCQGGDGEADGGCWAWAGWKGQKWAGGGSSKLGPNARYTRPASNWRPSACRLTS